MINWTYNLSFATQGIKEGETKKRRVKNGGYSVVEIQNGYVRYYQDKYRKLVETKKSKWETIDQNRWWCQLCPDGAPVDLLDQNLMPDHSKSIFYAPKDELRNGCVCPDCYWSALNAANTRGNRDRRETRKKREYRSSGRR